MSETPSYRLERISSGVGVLAAAVRDLLESERLEGAAGMLESLTDSFDDAEVIERYFPGLSSYSMETTDGVTTLRFETLEAQRGAPRQGASE